TTRGCLPAIGIRLRHKSREVTAFVRIFRGCTIAGHRVGRLTLPRAFISVTNVKTRNGLAWPVLAASRSRGRPGRRGEMVRLCAGDWEECMNYSVKLA